MLSVEQVTFRYDRRSQPVLRNASLSLDAGQVGVLLGRNGCGKTTLMRTLLGLCTPESGRIAFDGRDLTAIDRRQRARVAAYVPQDLQFGGLRVYDAVMAGRVARFGIQPGADDRAAVDAALEDMELTALAQRNVQQLSGGERQKVAIARALAKKPEVVVFDDSFSALDYKTDARLREELAKNVTDAALVVVAQRIATIMHADQIIVLDDGHVVGTGTHEELLRSCPAYLEIAQSQLSAEELGLTQEEIAAVMEGGER